jgi:hypothetical protein
MSELIQVFLFISFITRDNFDVFQTLTELTLLEALPRLSEGFVRYSQ